MNRSILSAASILLTLLWFSSCKKESFITGADARLGLTADTLRFDTVFTTTGSVTGADTVAITAIAGASVRPDFSSVSELAIGAMGATVGLSRFARSTLIATPSSVLTV